MRKRLSVVAVLVVPVLLVAFAAVAQEPTDAAAAEKEALARELLVVSGSGEMGVQVMEQMAGALRSTAPEMPDEFWDRLFAEVDADGLVDLVLPIYVEHLTVEEMRAAIAFYRTPEGQSLLEKMPVIAQESFAVGERWGMELAQRAMKEVLAAKEAAGEGDDEDDEE